MITVLTLVLVISLFTKVAWCVVKLMGEILGASFALLGYIIIGAIAVGLFGAAFVTVISVVMVCIVAGVGFAIVK